MAHNVILFAYGEMGGPVLESFLKDGRFRVQGAVIPKVCAEDALIKVRADIHEVETLRSGSIREIDAFIENKKPDAVIIATFNKIIPQKMLQKFPYINVHHGMLPRYRGRANVNWALINGLNAIGLTIHEAVPELDAGQIYFQEGISIDSQDTVLNVYEKLCLRLTQVLPDTIDSILKGKLKGRSQNETNATYCCTRIPEDGLIDWSLPSRGIERFVRALTRPYPGAFTYLDGECVRVWSAKVDLNPRIYDGRIPGRIILILRGEGVQVLTGDGVLLVQEIEASRFKGNASEYVKSTKQTFNSGLHDRIRILEEQVKTLTQMIPSDPK